MTQEQEQILVALERNYLMKISDGMRSTCPGLHACPDWDMLCIFEGSPEWQACTCPKSIAEAIGYQPE